MLTKQGFDLWADDYDQHVHDIEKNNQYPFAGYKEILNTIFNVIMQKKDSKILDIGFGTGVLAHKLYEHGHRIDGLDFSPKMISIAKTKMPDANLVEWDISNGLPAELEEKKYDFIISTYTLHHLTDKEKITLILKLLPLIEENGKILIGDISFETREKLEICKRENASRWDSDEFYFVYEEIKSSLKNEYSCEFHQISHCGSVIMISK